MPFADGRHSPGVTLRSLRPRKEAGVKGGTGEQVTSFFTGNLLVKVILIGSSKVSPVLGSDILVISGTMQANGVYVSDAWKMGTAVKVDAVMSTKLPVGSTLTVNCDAADGSWQSMPLSLSVVEDDGFIEQTYEKSSFTAVQGRLRLTLTGTPAARPTVADLRAYTI